MKNYKISWHFESFCWNEVSKIKSKLSQGVESERCASMSAALKAGKPVPTKVMPTLADGTRGFPKYSIFRHLYTIYIYYILFILTVIYTYISILTVFTSSPYKGLAVPMVGVNVFATVKPLLDKLIVLSLVNWIISRLMNEINFYLT